MTTFTINIEGQAALDGITWAKDEHNSQAEGMAQQPVDEQGQPAGDKIYHPAMPFLETDNDYVEWVMTRAAQSYAVQKANAPPPPLEIEPAEEA